MDSKEGFEESSPDAEVAHAAGGWMHNGGGINADDPDQDEPHGDEHNPHDGSGNN